MKRFLQKLMSRLKGTNKAGRQRRFRTEVELLERREVLSTISNINTGMLSLRIGAPDTVPYKSWADGGGLTPAMVQHAYGFDRIPFLQGSNYNTTAGAGQTIAIIDAFDDPTVEPDLQAFDRQFGLPDPTFQKINLNTGTPDMKGNASWTSEIALDVEWAHAMAPAAKILLIEAKTDSLADKLAAVDEVWKHRDVSVVSMSWHLNGAFNSMAVDQHFSSVNGGAVTFVESAGDHGDVPYASTRVVMVGGTTLTVDAQGNYKGEVVWNETDPDGSRWSSGGGANTDNDPTPGYQLGLPGADPTHRTAPDVSYNAGAWDDASRFPLYYTSPATQDDGSPIQPGWHTTGGTSAGAPQWAALIAITDQFLAQQSVGPLDGFSQTLPGLYSMRGDFHDITQGQNQNGVKAGPGYDQVTGLGTPMADRLVPDLARTALPKVSGPVQDVSRGSPATASITEAGTANEFHLQVAATRQVVLRVAPTAFNPTESAYEPGRFFRINVLDASGAVVYASNAGGNVNWVDFQAMAGTPYRIQVSALDPNWTGGYQLFVGDNLPPASSPVRPISAPSFDPQLGTTYPGLADGSIAFGGDYNVYHLQLPSAGDEQVVVRVTDPPTGRPSGSTVGLNVHGRLNSVTSNGSPNDSGAVGVQPAQGSYRPNPPSSGTGAPGSWSISPLANPVVMVYDQNGNLVASGNGETPAFRLPGVNSPDSQGEGSFYTVVVGGRNNASAGDYELRVEAAPTLSHRQSSQSFLNSGFMGFLVHYHPPLTPLAHVPPGQAASGLSSLPGLDAAVAVQYPVAPATRALAPAAPAVRTKVAELAIQPAHPTGSGLAAVQAVRSTAPGASTPDTLFAIPNAHTWLAGAPFLFRG
jgi:hypothetical protein